MTKILLSTVATAGLVIALLALATGCQHKETSSRSESVAEPVQTAAPASGVKKIVFVGMKNACDCTRRRIANSWSALQNALGTPAGISLERLQVDEDVAKVETYQKQKPIMVIPAIYFVDGHGRVLKLLQGEVNEQQLLAVLETRAPAE